MTVVMREEKEKAVRARKLAPAVIKRQRLVAVSECNKLHEPHKACPIVIVASFGHDNDQVLPTIIAVVSVVLAPKRHYPYVMATPKSRFAVEKRTG
ncbi:MAG: hypothetical protein WCJ35_19390 [Planctomycetota bacterium]